MDHSHDHNDSTEIREHGVDIAGPSTSSLPPDHEKLLGLSSSETAAMLASPDIPVEITSSNIQRHSNISVFILLMRRSFLWVFVGILMMVLGIGIVQGALLPRIHACPSGASCPESFDINGTNVLPLLQSLMQYWLKIGVLIAAYGLLRLSAYQSWFIMMQNGNTIKNFDLNLGAIKGSFIDAIRLLLKRGNRWLSLFVLAQLAVNSAITLLVGLSVIRNVGELEIAFVYNSITHFPASTIATLNSDGQLAAISKVVSWALKPDLKHDNALLGTLVIPDGRSSLGVNTLPGGPKLHGDISCSGIENYTISAENSGLLDYIIDIRGVQYIAHNNMKLAVSMTNVGTASTHYLWVSNTSGILPNATISSDGQMYFSFCNHTITLDAQPQDGSSGVQYVEPNTPVTSGCDAISSNVCVSDSVNNAIISWWGGVGSSLWSLNCRGNVLGPLNSNGTFCPLTQGLWESTASSMLDALVQTSPRSGHDTQSIRTRIELLSTIGWWIQGLVPLLTLILYIPMIIYTVMISRGDTTFKELNLSEVIVAAQSEHVRDLVQSGQLGNARVRYVTSEGFTT
ncbi:hypothetical protein BDQ17DRAFT_1429549 [Cyathus striatus]|nr:hypothetical protein BDQ17DRAFT_1429549 [Cyathus striatus]